MFHMEHAMWGMVWLVGCLAVVSPRPHFYYTISTRPRQSLRVGIPFSHETKKQVILHLSIYVIHLSIHVEHLSMCMVHLPTRQSAIVCVCIYCTREPSAHEELLGK